MRCYCVQTDTDFYYMVDNAPSFSHDLITKAYYEKDGDSFRKWYPANIPDKEIVIPNYERLAPTIYLREKANWEEALDEFCSIAKRNNIDFILRGSTVACLNGVSINPTDIDVTIDVSSFSKMKEAFRENVIEPFVRNDSLMLVRYFGRLCVNNMWVDASAFPKKGYEVTDIEINVWNGHILKVQSLKACLNIYRQTGRTEYVSAIESYLR